MLGWTRTKRFYSMKNESEGKPGRSNENENNASTLPDARWKVEARETICDINNKSPCEQYGRKALKNTLNITAVTLSTSGSSHRIMRTKHELRRVPPEATTRIATASTTLTAGSTTL